MPGSVGRNTWLTWICALGIFFSSDLGVYGETPLGITVVDTIETMVESTVALPCVATQHPVGDTPNLLLFYREASNIPFFSYDARTGDFWREGSSKTRDARYEGRVYLNLTHPRKVHLNLEHVTIEDEGDFTCRVDFVSSPSLTSIVKLKVFANPTVGPTVRVGAGPKGTIATGSEVGPFHEGELLNLSCTVTGGYPTPLVTWWQDVTLLDNSSYLLSDNGPQVRVNELSIGPLTRQLVRQPFTCRSENNPLSPPMDRTIHVKIHMAPQSAILPATVTLRAGLEERLECRAKGSYPEANITWLINGSPLNFTSKETRQIGSDTVSWVHFVASPGINRARLTCTASSPTLPDPPVSAKVTLNVTHEPEVHLELGSSLQSDHIRQGDDVYFNCHAVANPPVLKIQWYKGEKEVRHNKASGVIVGGNNLVLQGVQRPDSGSYTCRATNTVATTASNPLALSIQYGPMCAQDRVTVTAVEGEVVTLRCQVDAYPSNVTFYWLFNNTVDSTRFRKNEYTSEGLESSLRYVAYSARDYGTVFCWASNIVGRQEDPCAFTLQPAGAPDSVHECVLTNQSAGSLHITCKPGADGGLTQKFRAAVYVAGESEPVRVLEGMSPVFTVEGLAPGEDYIVTLTAINRKGTSPPVSLEAFTLKVAENRMISGVSSSQPEPEDVPAGAVSPLLGVFLGIVGAFLLLATAAIFITRRHCSRGAARTPDIVAGQELEIKDENADTGGPGSSGDGHRGHDKLDTPDLTESDPFLVTSECSSGTASTPASAVGGGGGGGGVSGVFTIPAHIPPPPQYCSSSCNDLSPNQHSLHHAGPPGGPLPQQPQQQSVVASQHTLIHQAQAASQHSLHTSSPQQYRLQRSASVERCGTRAVIAQPVSGHSSSPTHWPIQHGTPVTFAIQQPGHSQLSVIYNTSTDSNLHRHHSQHHPPATQQGLPGCGDRVYLPTGASPSTIHYVQPLPGVDVGGGEPPFAVGSNPLEAQPPTAHHSGSSHVAIGLAVSHLGSATSSGTLRPKVTFIPEQGIEHGGEQHPSPKTRAKHVTWTGGSSTGEESAV